MAKPKVAPKSKKDLIVRTALECCIELGVAEATFAQISRRAKIPAPLMHYYFPTHESLMTEIVRFVLEDLREASLQAIERAQKRPDRALVAYIEAPFRWAEKKPGYFSVWLYFYYLATFRREFQDLNTTIRETGRERIKALLYEGIAKKIFRIPADADLDALAYAIQSQITGGVTQAFSERTPNLDRVIQANIQAILGSIGL